MFAVIQTGGKQYKVTGDDVILVEKLVEEPGKTIDITDVLMVGGEGSPTVGAPLVAGAKVKAEVLEQTRGEKLIVFKKKRRHNYRRKKGHRQDLTALRITSIELDGKQVAKAVKATPKKTSKPAETKKEKPVAAKKAAAPKTTEKKTAEKKPAAKKATTAKPKADAGAEKKAPAKKAPAAKKPAAKKTTKKED